MLDRLTDALGRLVSWGILLMMLTTCLVVALRYLFNSGNIILFQEVVAYLHATTFLLAAGWALKNDEHVRVDIFYRRMSTRSKAWVNALGTLFFLLPLAVFLLLSSFQFVERSWVSRESSANAGGIPYVYLLKALIPAMSILLIVQGVVELFRQGMVLCVSLKHGEKQDD